MTSKFTYRNLDYHVDRENSPSAADEYHRHSRCKKLLTDTVMAQIIMRHKREHDQNKWWGFMTFPDIASSAIILCITPQLPACNRGSFDSTLLHSFFPSTALKTKMPKIYNSDGLRDWLDRKKNARNWSCHRLSLCALHGWFRWSSWTHIILLWSRNWSR